MDNDPYVLWFLISNTATVNFIFHTSCCRKNWLLFLQIKFLWDNVLVHIYLVHMRKIFKQVRVDVIDKTLPSFDQNFRYLLPFTIEKVEILFTVMFVCFFCLWTTYFKNFRIGLDETFRDVSKQDLIFSDDLFKSSISKI